MVSPFSAYYFDYPYGMTPLKKTFKFNPVPKGVPERSVLGVECELWTEYVTDEATLDKRLYPRIAATAERGWSKFHTDYDDFKLRLTAAYNMFDNLGVKYATINEADPNPVAGLKELFKFGINALDGTLIESFKRLKLNKKRLKEKYSRKR